MADRQTLRFVHRTDSLEDLIGMLKDKSLEFREKNVNFTPSDKIVRETEDYFSKKFAKTPNFSDDILDKIKFMRTSFKMFCFSEVVPGSDPKKLGDFGEYGFTVPYRFLRECSANRVFYLERNCQFSDELYKQTYWLKVQILANHLKSGSKDESSINIALQQVNDKMLRFAEVGDNDHEREWRIVQQPGELSVNLSLSSLSEVFVKTADDMDKFKDIDSGLFMSDKLEISVFPQTFKLEMP